MDSKLNVAIVDYEMGNIKSIENAINHVGNFNIKIKQKNQRSIIFLRMPKPHISRYLETHIKHKV